MCSDYKYQKKIPTFELFAWLMTKQIQMQIHKQMFVSWLSDFLGNQIYI